MAALAKHQANVRAANGADSNSSPRSVGEMQSAQVDAEAEAVARKLRYLAETETETGIGTGTGTGTGTEVGTGELKDVMVRQGGAGRSWRVRRRRSITKSSVWRRSSPWQAVGH